MPMPFIGTPSSPVLTAGNDLASFLSSLGAERDKRSAMSMNAAKLAIEKSKADAEKANYGREAAALQHTLDKEERATSEQKSSALSYLNKYPELQQTMSKAGPKEIIDAGQELDRRTTAQSRLFPVRDMVHGREYVADPTSGLKDPSKPYGPDNPYKIQHDMGPIHLTPEEERALHPSTEEVKSSKFAVSMEQGDRVLRSIENKAIKGDAAAKKAVEEAATFINSGRLAQAVPGIGNLASASMKTFRQAGLSDDAARYIAAQNQFLIGAIPDFAGMRITDQVRAFHDMAYTPDIGEVGRPSHIDKMNMRRIRIEESKAAGGPVYSRFKDMLAPVPDEPSNNLSASVDALLKD